MDNASKALVIAGAVLTSILLVATGVQVYNSTGKGSADNAKQASEKMWGGVDLGMGLAGGSATTVELPTGWEVIEKPAGWTSTKVTAIKEKATGKIVALPDGYSISEVEDEQTVDGGLVITDGANEFVWIPVTTEFTEQYTRTYGETTYLEPTTLKFDTQTNLNTFYETKEDGITPYYTLETDFAYSAHYAEMVESVNKYDGFYVGRYETTIDGNSIGSKLGGTVLTAASILKEGETKVDTTEFGVNDPFYYRWWGLYFAQRNSNVLGNCDYVQTNMICLQQYDAISARFHD